MNKVIVCVATRTEARLIRRHSDRCRIVQCGSNGIPTLIEPLLALAPAGLVSFGFAGGLAATLAPGTILLPERLRTGDGRCWSVDTRWRDRVAIELDQALRVDAGDVLETRSVVVTPADKRSLHAATGVVAVDMESARLAELAARAGVPFLALRAVIDAADETLPASVATVLSSSGNIRLNVLLRVLASHPSDMLHLTCAYRAAARALALALDSARRALFVGGESNYSDRGTLPASLAE